jgi:hypothetical protein
LRAILFFILLAMSSAWAQSNIALSGKFASDSMLLGQIVTYKLSCNHPANIEVHFPSKSSNFGTFEMVEKVYFPSKTKANQTIDSAYYMLRSFNIEKFQQLSLQIFYLQNTDTIFVKAPISLIKLKQESSLEKLGITTKMPSILLSQSYWPVVLKTLLVAFLIFVWWQIFGQTVSNQIAAYFFERQHKAFLKNLKKLLTSPQKENIIDAYRIWKTYLSDITKSDLLPLTSSEIAEKFDSASLNETLSEIDATIYGTYVPKNNLAVFDTLCQVAERHYKIQKASLLNSKT